MLAEQPTYFVAVGGKNIASNVVHIVHGHQGAPHDAASSTVDGCDRVVNDPCIFEVAAFGIAHNAASPSA